MNKISGISFSGALTIVFIVLKLVGTITWSWWWVLSPIWISCSLLIGGLLVIFGGALIIGTITYLIKR